jgi:hypothetical protein
MQRARERESASCGAGKGRRPRGGGSGRTARVPDVAIAADDGHRDGRTRGVLRRHRAKFWRGFAPRRSPRHAATPLSTSNFAGETNISTMGEKLDHPP